jgi:hypothetical protein
VSWQLHPSQRSTILEWKVHKYQHQEHQPVNKDWIDKQNVEKVKGKRREHPFLILKWYFVSFLRQANCKLTCHTRFSNTLVKKKIKMGVWRETATLESGTMNTSFSCHNENFMFDSIHSNSKIFFSFYARSMFIHLPHYGCDSVIYRDPFCSESDIVLCLDSSHKPSQIQFETDPKDNLMHLKIIIQTYLIKIHLKLEYFLKLRFALLE